MKYSLKLDNDSNTSNNASHTNFSRDSDIPIFTPKKENTWEDLKSAHSNRKFEISAPTWNSDKFELPD